MNYQAAVEQAKNENKISAAAASNINIWLEGDKYAAYRQAVLDLIEARKWQTLNDNFWQIVPFGTGGRRGTVGIGSNRINQITMGESAQGFADYVSDTIDNAREKGVVIAYDTRLTSLEFSRFVASVFAANGYKVFLFDNFRSTPELSFAVRHLHTAAGVVVSASHNPANDNGFKAYWQDGGQIVPPHDANIIDLASKVAKINVIDFEQAIKEKLIIMIGAEVDQAYIKALLAESLVNTRSANIVYSPLHGTGQVNVLPLLAAAGFKHVATVPEQMPPDGHFPQVANNIPNPELPETAAQVIKLAKKTNADFALTTDPDADRLGVVARNESDDYEFLTGNQIAALIGYFVLSQMKEQQKLTAKHFLVRTIVTTDFLDAMAADFGVRIINNILIGFKYIGELIHLEEDEGDGLFLFGGEESHGILKGSYTRDKDAAIAALLIAEQASVLKDEGRSLIWQLGQLYRRYGLYWETLVSLFYAGAEGGAAMNVIMQNLRINPPTTLGGLKIFAVIDRLNAEHGPTGDVIILNLSADGHSRITIRPSGTEPKIKLYTQLYRPLAKDISDEALNKEKASINEQAKRVSDDLIAVTKKLVK